MGMDYGDHFKTCLETLLRSFHIRNLINFHNASTGYRECLKISGIISPPLQGPPLKKIGNNVDTRNPA